MRSDAFKKGQTPLHCNNFDLKQIYTNGKTKALE